MKNQQVNVNVSLMLQTALIYLGLAVSGWMLLRLVQACIWLPGYLKNQAEETEVSQNKRSKRRSSEPDGKKDI